MKIKLDNTFYIAILFILSFENEVLSSNNLLTIRTFMNSIFAILYHERNHTTTINIFTTIYNNVLGNNIIANRHYPFPTLNSTLVCT